MSSAAVLDRPAPIADEELSSPILATLPEDRTPEEGRAVEIIDVHCGWGATASAPGWNDAATVQAALRERGIQTAFVASDLARHFDPARGNAEVASVASDGGDLRGWLVLQPDHLAEGNALMKRYLYHSERFVGVALYPDPTTGRPVTLRQAAEVLNAYRRFAKPLLIAAPNAEAMLHVADIAREMSTTRVIASGMGGDDWREAVEIAVKPLNLYLDISGALSAEKIDYAIYHLHGARKILFASGAPHTDPAAILGLLDDLDLSPEDRARILSNNAQRLFNLENTDAVVGSDLRYFSGPPTPSPDEEDAPHLGMLAPDEEEESGAGEAA